jgi:hypothetical protein
LPIYIKGRREKQMTKATYICRGDKKKVVTYSVLFLFLFFMDFFKVFFGRFVTRGVQKHGKKSIWAHHKKCGFFFPQFFFPPSVVSFDFFLSRFWAFRDKERKKTR